MATVQFDFSTIFNADVIVTAAEYANDTNTTDELAGGYDVADGAFDTSAAYIEDGVAGGDGLPSDGVIAAVAGVHPEVTLKMSDSNAWKVETGSTTATVTNGQYSTVHVFASAGDAGAGNNAYFTITLNYSDSTSTTSPQLTAPDWFDDNVVDGRYMLIDHMDRLNTDGSLDDANDGALDDISDPAIFGFAVAANNTKTLTSITINVTANDAGVFAFFGGVATTETSSAVQNTAPTSTNDTVVVNEDATYTLTASDFGTYADAESSPLDKVKITTLESTGDLEYSSDGTTWSDVTLNQEITKTDIDAGKLRYTPANNANGDAYATFGFKVSDGTDYSIAAYTATINVTAVNDAPVFGDANTSSKVAVFSYPNLNGSDANPGNETENANLASIIQKVINDGGAYELDVSIKNFTDADFADKLDACGFFFMTDMESGNPSSTAFLPDASKTIIRDWVNDGGVIMMTGTYEGNDTAFLNTIFGWDLTTQSGTSWTLNTTNASGTPFAGGPASLNDPSATDSIGKGTVTNFKAIYGTDDNATVATIQYGSGTVIFLGYDYYDSGFAGTDFQATATQYLQDVTDGGSNTSDWVTQMIPRALAYSANLSNSGRLTETNAALTASDTILVSDADITDTVTVTVTSVAVQQKDSDDANMASDASEPNNAALLAMLSASPTPVVPNNATQGTLTWNFNSGDTAFNYLAAGEKMVLTYTLTATDSNASTATTSLELTIVGTNDTPAITSNTGGDTASINVAENSSTVTTVLATDGEGDTVTYSISGGADRAKFDIVEATGVLTFATAPNYESPTDTGTNNTYEVIVQASDGNGGTDTQTITVTVTDVDETPPAPAPDPTPTPTPPTTTVDGATVQTSTTTQTRTTTDTTGNTVTTTVSTETLTIAPVSDTRTDSTGVATTADIPLFWGESSRTEWATTASLPTGIGLSTAGTRAPTTTATPQSALADLIYYIDTTTPSTDPSKQEMLGGGQSFLNALPNIETLVVNKVTLTSSTTTASTTPITITGTANTITTTSGTQAPQEALVIDATVLPSGTTLQLNNVEFGVILGGNLTIRGGEGRNILFTGTGSQDIMCGEDDDELHAGDGDDTVGSAGGNDKVFGEAGNDTVFGGEGNDTLHGGSGTDKATYAGNMAEYTITRDEGYTYVALVSNPSEVDTLVNAETIQFADGTYTITSTTNQKQVATLYMQILDRQAEMGGYQNWTHYGEQGDNLGSMVLGFVRSEEYKLKTSVDWDTLDVAGKIEEFYQAILGRASDAGGKQHWINYYNSGATFEQVAEGFVDSIELSGLYQEQTQWNFFL